MATHAADRNLLFGILALQMDFITRDQLVAGMNAWVLEKHKPLGQILNEQKALREDLRAALDVMVDKHIEVHHQDAQASLASLGSISSASRFLKLIFDDDVQASLARLAANGNAADSKGTDLPTTAHKSSDQATGPVGDIAQSADGRRFRVLRPHAKGGLGEVFVAEDAELNRQVALKEIQERHAGDQDSRGRFVMEAEITGRLEHPGIVPVYSLGAHADGRPFYVMRFIKGDSLKEAIERYHKPQGESSSPGGETPRRAPDFNSLDFRQLLRRFLDVCNAVAFAHSRGVLHRDLKPGNIMLGEFGETLVVDWGLAKIVGTGNSPRPSGGEGLGVRVPEPLPTLRPASGSGVAATVAGAAMGTPQFMSPEQAAGRIADLSPASDVYSLGATLYALLTGVPPVERGDLEVVLANVQMGEFPRPRQRQPGVSAALEAICLKAMALRPEDRYATPRALADDVEHWLADEPVTAWREPWLLKANRWVKRNHRLVVWAVFMVMLLLLVTISIDGSVRWIPRTIIGLAFLVFVSSKLREKLLEHRSRSRNMFRIGSRVIGIAFPLLLFLYLQFAYFVRQPVRNQTSFEPDRAINAAIAKPQKKSLENVASQSTDISFGVETEVGAFLTANPERAVELLTRLKEKHESVFPLLLKLWDATSQSVPEETSKSQQIIANARRSRVALALLPLDSAKVKPWLISWMLQPEDPGEIILIREGLDPFSSEIVGRLWRQVETLGVTSEQGFRAMVFLAAYDPRNDRWRQNAPAVVNQLMKANPLHLGPWAHALRPVRGALVPHLNEILQSPQQMSECRRVAGVLLKYYATD